MLVLSRRRGESIVLYTDEGLKITIVMGYQRGNQTALLINAPMSVHVDRAEIYNRKQQEASAV